MNPVEMRQKEGIIKTTGCEKKLFRGVFHLPTTQYVTSPA